MKKFRLHKVQNVKDNNASINTLEQIKYQIKLGKLDFLFHPITSFEDIDAQIEQSRQYHQRTIGSTLDQIREYNEYLKNKIDTDYTKANILERTDPSTLDGIVFTILNYLDKDLLRAYVNIPEERKREILEKIDPNMPDYLVGRTDLCN